MDWEGLMGMLDDAIGDAAVTYARIDRELRAGQIVDANEYARCYALSIALAEPRAICQAHLRATRMDVREVTHAPVE